MCLYGRGMRVALRWPPFHAIPMTNFKGHASFLLLTKRVYVFIDTATANSNLGDIEALEMDRCDSNQ